MTAQITYGHQRYAAAPGETVLSCLTRNGVSVPHACCAGVCQSCLLQATEGVPPTAAQKGLKPALQQKGFFLACQCLTEANLTVALPDADGVDVAATVLRTEMLNHNVMRLILAPEAPFPCEPGQYLTLIADRTLARSYSIANDVQEDGYIELQIRLMPDGQMSRFLQGNARAGLGVTLRGPAGSCFYVAEGNQDYPLILAGTGTGLAPLAGIARRALAQGHRGDILLFHGALKPEDLYLGGELGDLAQINPQFRYQACVLNGDGGSAYSIGNIEDFVLAALPATPAATRLFLCGAPEFVNSLRRKAFLRGVASRHIYVDAFLPAQPAPVKSSAPGSDAPQPPRPELLSA